MKRDEFIRQLELVIRLAEQNWEKSMRQKDDAWFRRINVEWHKANEMWLQVARGMSPDEAHAVLVYSATKGEIARWTKHRIGPPPPVFEMYDGPLSDEELIKVLEQQGRPLPREEEL